MIASCGFLEDELRQCSKEEGVTMADSVEMLGVDLRTRVKVGSQRKSEKKEVQGEILAYQEEYGLPKELHEGGRSRSCYERVWCQQGRGEYMQWK